MVLRINLDLEQIKGFTIIADLSFSSILYAHYYAYYPSPVIIAHYAGGDQEAA